MSIHRPLLSLGTGHVPTYHCIEDTPPLIERGCSALTDDLEKNAVAAWKSLNKITCNGENVLALEHLYSLAADSNSNGYRLLSKHIERIFTAAIETSLNEVDCKDGEVRHTALHLILVLSERHVGSIPNIIVSDIVLPSVDLYPHLNLRTTVGHCHVKPILSTIGTERACEHLIIITEQFFESEDWKRRGAALICWAILGREWRNGLMTFLFDLATAHGREKDCKDESSERVHGKKTFEEIIAQPRVPAAADDLLADMFQGGCIRGDSDLLQKMVSSLVTLIDDHVHQVKASALVALVYLHSSVAVHACAVDIIIKLAEQVGWTQFKNDFHQVEPALCALLSSLQPSYRHYGHVCASVQRLCHMVEDNDELTSVLTKMRH
ncbi:hypothetical protein PRIPAC_89190 [Pristionchus pacificus]|uniref:Uncharacterized protein n=1 Tax=Pristionchus pacificus TaxID=54126 RepID=A0A2A6B8C2_PRIPA|nr:hypothetical protein PRIPAC_89190 [Pristionchus pacificus]|eukprot:PDM62121.1 hypothetical protein PRIPAC_51563 [Pristionchus pacificus]